MDGYVARLLALCAECRALTLATLGPQGKPMAAAVFFAYTPSLELYFLSDLGTQHSLNLARDPRAAVCLYPPSPGWRDIRAAQMRGHVRPLEGRAAAAGWEAYRRRFSFVAELKAALRRASLHCFTPAWIRLIDNRFAFGHKEEWAWPAA